MFYICILLIRIKGLDYFAKIVVAEEIGRGNEIIFKVIINGAKKKSGEWMDDKAILRIIL